ncbi:MAG: tetratricopeptide repeat protein [Gemmataceae bacterium]
MITRLAVGIVSLSLPLSLPFVLAATLLAAPVKPDDRQAVLELNTITGNAAILGKIDELSKMPDTAKKLVKTGAELAKQKDSPLGYNSALILGQLAEKFKLTDEGLALYKHLGQLAVKRGSNRGVATALLGMVELNTQAGKHEEAEKNCLEIIRLRTDEEDPLDNIKSLAFRRMILAIARQGKSERALGIIDDEIKAQPRNFLMRALKAQLFMELKKYDDAVAAYKEVIENVESLEGVDKSTRDELADDYRYILSAVYTEAGKPDKAIEVLRELLKRHPDNPGYNNDLGFILADNDKELEEAERLIRKALEEDRKARAKAAGGSLPKDDKDNASYLDSLGWVLFKRGKAKEAKPYLERAVQDPRGQHLEIFDHLGDVHMALGEVEAALAAWKKGLETATDSVRDQKRKLNVEKKIREAMKKK